MRITRIIAVSLGLGVLGSMAGAQTLANASPPSEFPPASFKGKQYVDSRGCVYIRAGIDGNVTWVPRVTRSRKQVCGYKPTLPNARAAEPVAPRQDDTVVEIRNDPQPDAKPTATASAQPATPGKPRRQGGGLFGSASNRVATPSPGPAPTVFNSAPAVKPAPAPKPVQVARPVRPVPKAVPRRPAPEPTVIVSAPAPRVAKPAPRAAAANVSDRTRVVRRHIYEARQGWVNLSVPSGYRTVWEDDRLNPRRAERDLRPNIAQERPRPPQGYKVVWEDERLNYRRGAGTARGDAAMAQVWQDGLPRRLVKPAPAQRIVTRQNRRARPNSPYWETEVAAAPARQPAKVVTRVSTRSAPPPKQQIKPQQAKPSYLRVATYADDASARAVAKSLARQGLPMRLGSVKRQGATLRVVMAGPFATQDQANSALQRLNRAGYKARLLR